MLEQGKYLEKIYRRLSKSDRTNDLNLPRSSVFFVRRAIQDKTGEDYSVEHVRISMWLEGELPVGDVLKIPQWYVDKYMGGKCDFDRILKYVKRQRRKKLEEVAEYDSAEH